MIYEVEKCVSVYEDIWYDVIMSASVVTCVAKLITSRICCVCTCTIDTRLKILR